MAEPLRERVLVQVEEIFRGMTGHRPAFAGSYADGPVVEREYREPTQVTRFPHLIVREAAGSSWRQIAVNGHFEDGFRVVVYGYVQSTPGVSARTWLQRLLWDVKRTLAEDTTLRTITESGVGAVRGVDFSDTSEVTDEGLLELEGARAAFAFEFGVVLDEALTVA